jgi:MoxR-like ATPase
MLSAQPTMARGLEFIRRESSAVFLPKTASAMEELGVPASLVEDIVLRHLYTRGSSSLREMGKTLKLARGLLQDIVQRMRLQPVFDIVSANGSDATIGLSAVGRELAAKRFLVSHYAGPVPVPLTAYAQAVRLQNTRVAVDRATLRAALADLVVTDRFLDELGPAIVSQRSIFLYGPTGNGKTSILTRLARIHQDTVVIPHAVEVDGQVIVVFDPSVHHPVEEQVDGLDPRWVVCRRPCVMVGGELEPSMLELQLEKTTRIYAAPVQMRANNGTLVIDDFGRQAVSPMFLLNRWIVPLDRRVDYLTLRQGLKFQVPFELAVVFATNIDPNELADEAFMRRIPNKIFMDAVDDEGFDRIFAQLMKARKLTCSAETPAFLRRLCYELGGGLKACQPADVIDVLISISEFEGSYPAVTPENLSRAARLYFTKPKAD